MLRIEKRTNETFCFQHGTVQFSRQTSDIVENDSMEHNVYPTDFIFKAAKFGMLTIDELARELSISKSTVKNAINAAKKERA